MKGVFVTGTGTGVGKSWVAAWLTKSWNASYWKPVQTGADEGTDIEIVARAAPAATIYPSRYLLPEPLSPNQAARRHGTHIRLDDFRMRPHGEPVVVEGAGGVLVPLNERSLMVDLMAKLALPIVVVAPTGLGTLNHTLLTLEALRHRQLPVAGLILTGPEHPDNQADLQHFGKVTILGHLPPLPDLAALTAHPPIAWCPF